MGLSYNTLYMTDKERKAVCNGCGDALDEVYNLPELERKPCPRCGLISRVLQVDVFEKVELHESMRLRHNVLGRAKPQAEIVSGDDLHRKTGIWMKLSRVIDRGKNWYEEIVTNPTTGKVFHRTSHPLTQHIGHGSAKKKGKSS